MVVQLICNTSFARLHEWKLFTSALTRTAHQQVIGSSPTGSCKDMCSNMLSRKSINFAPFGLVHFRYVFGTSTIKNIFMSCFNLEL